MTGAIEFLKHAREMCSDTERCSECPLIKNYGSICPCRLKVNYFYLSDNEIADLVREVERWWREEGEKNG